MPASNRRYGYTKLDQLCFDTPTSDTTSTCAAPGVGATPYAYDTADNTVRTAANSKQKYNTADQLCWSVAAGSPPDACGTVPSGGTGYTYDSRGNRVTAGTTSYSYDQANRLTQTTGAVTGAGNNGEFTAVTPARLLDTRDIANAITLGLPIAAGNTIDLPVLGAGGIPASDVAAVQLTVSVAAPAAAGWVTIYPAGQTQPTVSNLNYNTNQAISNALVVKPGDLGKIRIFSSQQTHVIIDVTGYYATATGSNGGQFTAVTPARVRDSRTDCTPNASCPASPANTLTV